jgi:hypothetical protein
MLLFTEAWMPSGFFIKEKPLGRISKMPTSESKML